MEPVLLVGAIDLQDPRYEALRQVVPVLSTKPPRDWTTTFDELCRFHRGLNWDRGEFARCRPGQQNDVVDMLRELVARANERHVLADLIPEPARTDGLVLLIDPDELDSDLGYVYGTPDAPGLT